MKLKFALNSIRVLLKVIFWLLIFSLKVFALALVCANGGSPKKDEESSGIVGAIEGLFKIASRR